MHQQDPANFHEARYVDSVQQDEFGLQLAQGPEWRHLATKFRTPYNRDLTMTLDGPPGTIFISCDGGFWWFTASYDSLTLDVDKTVAYRLNQAEPWVRRAGQPPYARMINRSFSVIDWVPPMELPARTFTSRQTHTRLLSVTAAQSEGYSFATTSGPHPAGALPNTFVAKPEPVTLAAPVESDFQITVDTVTYTLPLYNTMLAAYNTAVANFSAQETAWDTWKLNFPMYVVIRDGRVVNLLLSSGSLHVGLIPCYDNEMFIGWGAVEEKRVEYVYQDEDNMTHTVFTPWVPTKMGVSRSLAAWNDDPDEWVAAPDGFNPLVDPRGQGPF